MIKVVFPLPMRVAIDTGGTFTDCVFVRDGKLQILKVPSTPSNPAQAVGDVLGEVFQRTNLAQLDPSLDLVCGTTVGTNALLQRRGACVVLVTTAGFEDILEIGRQARPRLYDFMADRPAPLVPHGRRIGFRERVAADGRALLRPSRAEINRVARAVTRSGADSVAICLLFSYANPAHEKTVAQALRRRGYLVSVSHEILPEFREFERTATTVVNAYLAPVMSQYLNETRKTAMESSPARRAEVRVMQSSGGIISAAVAAREPVRTILSGPAGGVLGAKYVAECSGFRRIIGFDMGGTSTDVALIEGDLRTSNEASVAELPVAVPVLDIHTVGAGGGSIARFDRAGALRVGPESAGADPGPICYGHGDLPTVTDAHLILGRLGGAGLLGGAFRLDESRTREWMRRALQKAPRVLRTLEDFAQGIVDVANAAMEKAIRVISVERGYDARDYALVAFGGAGALHACDLAAALGIPRVLVPQFPGALSALGILRADVVKDFSQTVRLETISAATIQGEMKRAFAVIERRGLRDMRAEGFVSAQVRIDRVLDARYVGQAYELTIPAEGDFVRAFHRTHEKRYGYADRKRAVEVVTLRARMSGATPKPGLPRAAPGPANPQSAQVEIRRVFFSGRSAAAIFYDRAKLRPGMRLAGPAIVNEYSATTAVPPAWEGRVDAWGNILLEPRKR